MFSNIPIHAICCWAISSDSIFIKGGIQTLSKIDNNKYFVFSLLPLSLFSFYILAVIFLRFLCLSLPVFLCFLRPSLYLSDSGSLPLWRKIYFCPPYSTCSIITIASVTRETSSVPFRPSFKPFTQWTHKFESFEMFSMGSWNISAANSKMVHLVEYEYVV